MCWIDLTSDRPQQLQKSLQLDYMNGLAFVMYLLSCSSSWTRHLTLTRWNSTGNLQTIGYHQVKLVVWVNNFFFAASTVNVGHTFLVTGSKKKLDQLGSVCINLNSNTSFKQSLRMFKHNWKQKQDRQPKRLIGYNSPKHVKQNKVTSYALRWLKGLQEKADYVHDLLQNVLLFTQSKSTAL